MVSKNKGTLISVKSLTKELGGNKILKGITFDVVENEILALVGPNGAGKTTTIRCLTGIYNLGKDQIIKKDGLTIGVVSEKDLLWEKETGWKNIEIFREYLGGKLSNDQIESYAKYLDISEFLPKKVHTYSKGTRRKFSFILGLLKDPKLLILDEPMSGLDPVSRIKMRELIFKLNKEGKSIFYTSHDLAEVEKLAHRVMLMKKGEIVLDNLKSDILSNYRNLEELFLEKVGVHIDEENNEI
ncbi:ABC transporter [Petrotoga mexicana DSM 14811]|uniref:ABC transporter n=1 Tax=Petrotoga mexicana DSM 14811 TaxID=1122954 RepID=A0A2K1PFF9_9BACT|nr:ABC transporter ATP-binding protein [Petrotoga mexicana]PNS01532.1 ABC transporter [Petrotoga mexicana DSM 14811]